MTEFFADRGHTDGKMSHCKDCKKAAMYAWREANADRLNAYRRARAAKPEIAARNSDLRSAPNAKSVALARERRADVRSYRKAWRESNPDKVKIYEANKNSKRRAIVKDGPGISLDEWSAIKLAFGHRCAYCKKKSKLTMDHRVALSRGGLHCSSNIVPSCLPCNTSKHAKDPTEFALQEGRLCW